MDKSQYLFQFLGCGLVRVCLVHSRAPAISALSNTMATRHVWPLNFKI